MASRMTTLETFFPNLCHFISQKNLLIKQIDDTLFLTQPAVKTQTCDIRYTFSGSKPVLSVHDQTCDIYSKFVTLYFSKDFPSEPNLWHFWINLQHPISQTNSCKKPNLWHVWHIFSLKMSVICTWPKLWHLFQICEILFIKGFPL